MRLIHAFYLRYFDIIDNVISNKIVCEFWYKKRFEKISDNSYILALSFYKNIITNLKESSALTVGFSQLYGFVLTNYLIDEKTMTYSLTNEPLKLFKYHLLSNYDEFFLIYDHYLQNDSECDENIIRNDNIILINERKLFDSNTSGFFSGKDVALLFLLKFLKEKNHIQKINLNTLELKILLCYIK